ncbi:hypothetical protein F2Q69_00045639 [Brassica cretica]|uniref:Uncharacterized protein n=1 Tax=Brassica cretica TaxID=69181 RepID=A0A8S9NJP2_BRACR|nr:hypothetical protein F2Q69_00045639 [Brassica cretica]
MSEIVNTINALCQERNQIPPEIDCCLKDLPGNDFNTTFKFISFFNEKLTSKTPCFVSGVPGSFHSRLFPSKSLHFIHSNCGLNYLSKVPEGLEKNKMSVYITSSSPLSEYKAYLNQFQKDFTTFLRMRSEEMVSNGRMVITLLGRNAIDDPLYRDCCHHLTLVSDSLRDLVFEGLVSASKVISFNMPLYDPTDEELKEIIINEGSFQINDLETHAFDLGHSKEENRESCRAKPGEKEANCIRAAFEMMLVAHFGDAINIDTLFAKYAHHVSQHASCMRKTSVILVVSCSCSHGWRGIMSGRDIIVENSGWAIGDGESLNVWDSARLSLSQKESPMGPAPEALVELKSSVFCNNSACFTFNMSHLINSDKMYAFFLCICLCMRSIRSDGKSENEMSNGDEECSNYTRVSILNMRGGDGHNSYATNSLLQGKQGKKRNNLLSNICLSRCFLQRRVLSMSKPILVKNTKEMMTNLEFPKCIKVADLGCSSGQNTFLAMSEIVNTINALCQERNQNPPEIDCCLNDLPGNDFNTTFKFISFFNDKLTSNTPCFVSGVPGSFYSRLFPSKSLHFIHSNYSVNYPSKVPEGLEKNKMGVYITSSSPLSEYKAYLNQFQKDFNTFLRMRSEEMVSNGRMVITLLGRNTIDDPLYRDCCHHLTLLSDSLRDLVIEGLVSASTVNSFNMPFYDPTEEEVKEIIRNEASFQINDLETHAFDLGHSKEESSLQSCRAKSGEKEANCIRAATETMLVAHFRDAINIDTLFAKYAHHVSQHASCINKTSITLVASLVRK